MKHKKQTAEYRIIFFALMFPAIACSLSIPRGHNVKLFQSQSRLLLRKNFLVSDQACHWHSHKWFISCNSQWLDWYNWYNIINHYNTGPRVIEISHAIGEKRIPKYYEFWLTLVQKVLAWGRRSVTDQSRLSGSRQCKHSIFSIIYAVVQARRFTTTWCGSCQLFPVETWQILDRHGV